MRAAVAHFAAAAVFAALYIGLYLNKNEEVESYETSCVRHLESLKSGDRSFDFEEYVSVKYGTKEGEEPGYSAIWKKDKNLTVEKIDASLSKKLFQRLTNINRSSPLREWRARILPPRSCRSVLARTADI